MDFYAVFDQAVELVRRRRRVSYRALQAHLVLDNEKLEALREELLYAYPDAVTEDGQGMVWPPDPHSRAERRQVTVMFCDLVNSTPLANQFDPEEWCEVVKANDETCEKVFARFDGHVGNYLGDGLLVYFGFPRAHEDDALRAIRAGLARPRTTLRPRSAHFEGGDATSAIPISTVASGVIPARSRASRVACSAMGSASVPSSVIDEHTERERQRLAAVAPERRLSFEPQRRVKGTPFRSALRALCAVRRLAAEKTQLGYTRAGGEGRTRLSAPTDRPGGKATSAVKPSRIEARRNRGFDSALIGHLLEPCEMHCSGD